jgi:hypothetical protein
LHGVIESVLWIDAGFVVFLLAVLVPLVIALRRPG